MLTQYFKDLFGRNPEFPSADDVAGVRTLKYRMSKYSQTVQDLYDSEFDGGRSANELHEFCCTCHKIWMRRFPAGNVLILLGLFIMGSNPLALTAGILLGAVGFFLVYRSQTIFNLEQKAQAAIGLYYRKLRAEMEAYFREIEEQN